MTIFIQKLCLILYYFGYYPEHKLHNTCARLKQYDRDTLTRTYLRKVKTGKKLECVVNQD